MMAMLYLSTGTRGPGHSTKRDVSLQLDLCSPSTCSTQSSSWLVLARQVHQLPVSLLHFPGSLHQAMNVLIFMTTWEHLFASTASVNSATGQAFA